MLCPFALASAQALTALGLDTHLEQLTPDRLFSLDMVVHLAAGTCTISIEANGPQHYARCCHADTSSLPAGAAEPQLEHAADLAEGGGDAAGGWRTVGSKRLRDDFLRARGYLVLHVPHWEWDALGGDRARQEEYLVRRLSGLLLAAAAPPAGARRKAPPGGGPRRAVRATTAAAAVEEMRLLLAERQRAVAAAWAPASNGCGGGGGAS